MCKVCDSCRSLMNYDPYFEAEVCGNCGKIEREKKKQSVNVGSQIVGGEVLKRIMSVMTVR